jgi:hypothetical protein
VAPNGKRFYSGKRCDTETFSGVIVDEQRIGRFTLDAGIRWTRTYLNDYGAFNIEGDGALFKNVTPIEEQWEPAVLQASIGASWNLNNWFSIYLNSIAGQIKPKQGSLTTDLLEPENESRYKLDLGLTRMLSPSGKITAAAFAVFQKNAIVLSGDTYLDDFTNIRRELYLNRNQDQLGFEFEVVSPRLFNLVEPFLSLMWMKSTRMDEGKSVTNEENPAFISGGGIYMNRKGYDLNMFCKYVSPFENERFAAVTDGPQPLGDFFILDINGGYTTRGKIPVRLYIEIKNVNNKKYSTVIGYPDFGRMIFAGIQLKLHKDKPTK